MVVCGLRGDALMDESGEFAGRIRPDCHALLRRRTATNSPKYPLARQRKPDRPSRYAGGENAELVIGPKPTLTAETSTDKWRDQADVFPLQPKYRGNASRCAHSELAGVV